jgi:pimeloyl-ACP methyl ester carboxylesterase
MATYVLVHGGGHGGWCYQRLAPLLRDAGHEVYAPTLTGLGERSHLLDPRIDLDTHITDVVNVLRYEDLTDVILAGHSYGGLVITGVADRAGDRVGHLVFMDAAIPVGGDSLASLMPGIMDTVRAAGRTVDGVEVVLCPGPEAGRVFGVTDPDDVAWMQDRLTPHPWNSFAQPLRLDDEAAVRRIPRTVIVNTRRRESHENQPDADFVAERDARARQADRVFEIETGHDLMITEPRRVADMLLQLATD